MTTPTKENAPQRLAHDLYRAYDRPRPHLGQLRDDMAAQGVTVTTGLLRKWKERGHLGEAFPDDCDTRKSSMEGLVSRKIGKLTPVPTEGSLTLKDLDRTVRLAHGTIHGLLDLINDSIRPQTVGDITVPGIKLEDADDIAATARAVGIISKAMDDVLVHNKLLDEAKAAEASTASVKPAALPSPKVLLRIVREEQEAAEQRKAHG